MNRQEILTALRQKSQLSVLIVGAGINGIGTFRDLALQGVDVLLVDRADFCSGTSAASSHMAHGGIRYLENGEFRLVREAVEERNRLLQNAPHYVKPLPTVIPIFRWFSGLFNAPLKFLGWLDKPSERGAAIIKMGLLMYDAYTAREDTGREDTGREDTGHQRTVPRHELLLREQALQRYPQINPEIVCVAEYYDGLIQSPERICVELIGDAEANSPSARAVNYVSVVGASGENVQLRDEVSGDIFNIQPQLVINAAGPWVDFANAALGQPSEFIGGTKGSHLVLNHPELRQAIGEHEFFFENKDGRIVLLCPLLDRVLVGTSDIRLDAPDEAVCTDAEIDYFLGMVSRVFPNIRIDKSQIVFTFSGVRPLPASKANSTGQISRDHSLEMLEASNGLAFPILNLISGKWTTFRAFAAQATDVALRRLGQPRQQATTHLPIGGGKEYPHTAVARTAWVDKHQQQSGLPRAQVEILFQRYGTLAAAMLSDIAARSATGATIPLQQQSDYLVGEIAYLARQEKVVHLDDFVLRRSFLGISGRITRPLLAELAEVVGEALGWSAAQRASEVARTTQILAMRHRVHL